jgi:hypothetical protein
MQGPPLYFGIPFRRSERWNGRIGRVLFTPLQSPQPVAAGRQGAEATLVPYMTGPERSALLVAVEENKLVLSPAAQLHT